MKRVEEARLIKLSETPNGSGGAQLTVAAPPTGTTIISHAPATIVNNAAGTTIFPTRAMLSAAEMGSQQQPVALTASTNSSGGQTSFTRIISQGSAGGGSTVSLLSSESGVAITPVGGPSNATPPVAHGGVSSLAHPALHAAAQLSNPVVTQPPSNIKPEPISLPTAPVSVHYATTNLPANLSTSIKTPAATSHSSNVQTVVQNIQQQGHAHHQQIVHQKSAQQTISYGPSSIRTISTGNLPTSVNNVTPVSISTPASVAANVAVSNAGNAQFQRLKVEDALSYLDQVKFKFGNQPQVYNDFLDIMKEFKSQSIDTPGVIARVSSLFKGHPELIVGFNTFLPPGYKIEVQCNEAISVSMPGILGAGMQTIVHTPHGIHTMGAHGHMSPAIQSLPSTTTATPAAGTTIRPITIPIPSQQPQPQPALQPQQQQQNVPKFTTTIKTENLLPQQPAPAHIQQGTSHNAGQNFSPAHIINNGTAVLTGSATITPAAATPNVNTSNAASNQPVEFNHAINYVNKIKNRFQGQPEVYKQFLEILHTYQKDQKAMKEGAPPSGKYLSEAEVYAQVSKLFQNQEDLLAEFGQFLPEATNDQAQNAVMSGKVNRKVLPSGAKPYGIFGASGPVGSGTPSRYPNSNMGQGQQIIGKRPTSGLVQPPPKKQKMGALRDVSLAEAGKYGTLNEFAFFDKVRKALRSPEVYNNFLRCLVLFNQEVISRQELVMLTSTFLQKHPDLFKWFKEFVGHKDGQIGAAIAHSNSRLEHSGITSQPSMPPGRERMSGDSAMDIDYATCKRLGASYCALPKSFVQPKCSGRTPLCKEVLNDTWVSFPSWSEDSQFVTSRKTQFEEFIYRTEDERFEFDVVLETNKDTIKVLECVQKKMSRMPPEEAARYKLDDCLGGTSATIHQRAIRRIYGDKAGDIIDGLKRNPVVAVPLVLRRLKAKDEEWRDVQKNFNKIWREQNEKYYLKSLDHQGIMFKQTDTRSLRSKALLNEIENLYDERHEQEDNNESGNNLSGPHMTLNYEDDNVLEDANNLLIHHVKRQTSIQKEEKRKVKILLRHFLLDLFRHRRQDLSDDEREEMEEDEIKEENDDSDDKENSNGSKATRSERARKKKEDNSKSNIENSKSINNSTPIKKEPSDVIDVKPPVNKDGRKTPPHARNCHADESYSLIMCNNNWYLFLRLHNILCNRLTKIYNQAVIIANEEGKGKKDRKESTATALRLKPKRLLVSQLGPYASRSARTFPNFPTTSSASSPTPSASASTQPTTSTVNFSGSSLFSQSFNRLFSCYPVSKSRSSDPEANEIEPDDYYPAFLDMVKNVLDGNMELQAYEDTLREMFGIHAYIAFTLDKVITNAVRQLQYLVTDEAAIECHELFLSEAKNHATGGPCSTAFDRIIAETVYQKKAEKILADENCMKIYIYHRSKKMTIEMLDTDTDSQASEQEESTKKLQAYVEKFIQPGDEVSEECKEHLAKKPVFLPRGIRSYSKSPFGKMKLQNQYKGPRKSANKEDEGSKSDEDTKSDRLKHIANNGVIHEDNTQCQFDPKTFKILYVIDSENCFYRKQALKRAKESHKKVSQRKTSDFNRWHKTWLKDNVPESQNTQISDWFLGKTKGLVPNKTVKNVRNDPDRAPYRPLVKYKAEILKQPDSASSGDGEEKESGHSTSNSSSSTIPAQANASEQKMAS